MTKEIFYVNTWLKKYHPNPPLWIRPRLGKVAFPEFAKEMSVCQRFPDAVCVDNGTVYIIEAKLKPSPNAIGQLMLYKNLFYETPEFEHWFNCPIELVLLTTREDKNVRALCDQQNIVYIVYNKLTDQ